MKNNIILYQVEVRTAYRHFPEQNCWDEECVCGDMKSAIDICKTPGS